MIQKDTANSHSLLELSVGKHVEGLCVEDILRKLASSTCKPMAQIGGFRAHGGSVASCTGGMPVKHRQCGFVLDELH